MTAFRSAALAAALVLPAGLAACGSGTGAGAPSGGRAQASQPSPAAVAALERSSLRERAIEVLESYSFDEWALLRANAIEGLQRAPSRVERVALAGVVDEHFAVRFTAAMTIGELRIRTGAAAVSALRNDPSEAVRAASVYARSRLGEPVDRTPLAGWLMSADASQRMRTAFILGELGDASAIPLLKDVARRLHGPDGDALSPAERRLLHLQIAEALAKLGERGALGTVRAALYPASEDEFEAAVLAAQMLGQLRDQDAARQLVVLVESRRGQPPGFDPEAEGPSLYPIELRQAAARSLAQMGFRDGGFVAEEGMLDGREAVRAQAAFVFGAVADEASIQRLEGMIDDESPQVRVAAAAALLEAFGGGDG